MTLAIVSLLWDATETSEEFSRCYDESWVEKLYIGFERNLTCEFEFILYTDRPRVFGVPVSQVMLPQGKPDYGWCILPYRMGRPMILVGLDTVITGNCDHLADYCMTAERFAVPRDPYHPHQVCNGVALVPEGHADIGLQWSGENDMIWVRKFGPAVIDDLFPGHVCSYKGHVKEAGIGDARIVYFHGHEKPHQLAGTDWIERHWNGVTDMARFVQSVKGEKVETLSGWSMRVAAAQRKRGRLNDPDRAAADEARRKIIAGEAEAPQASIVQTIEEIEESEEPSDVISAMTDEDLSAYYATMFGERPHGRTKRETIERRIREALQ